jgi:hypothetical protein
LTTEQKVVEYNGTRIILQTGDDEDSILSDDTGIFDGLLPQTNAPSGPSHSAALFANGIGALTATSRLASLARKDNIFLLIAAMIAMDYFELISRVQSVVPVC